MRQEKIINKIIKALPYAGQIKGIDLSEANAVRFQWRSDTYRVNSNLFVEECRDSCLVGSSKAILMEALIKLEK